MRYCWGQCSALPLFAWAVGIRIVDLAKIFWENPTDSSASAPKYHILLLLLLLRLTHFFCFWWCIYSFKLRSNFSQQAAQIFRICWEQLTWVHSVHRQLCRSWQGDKKLPACHLDCPLKQASYEEADYCMVVKNAPVCLLLLARTLVWVTQEAKQSSGRGPVKVPLMGEGGWGGGSSVDHMEERNCFRAEVIRAYLRVTWKCQEGQQLIFVRISVGRQ